MTHLTKYDLNLFKVFVSVYNEGSVSRCANRLNLTQPAVSHSLSRLRELFGDPLFVRQGNRMVPTPKSRSIIDDVKNSLDTLDSSIHQAQVFDPEHTQKRFVLGLNETLESRCLPELIQVIESSSPGIDISCLHLSRIDMESELRSGKIDFAIDVIMPISESIAHQPVAQEPLVVVASQHHSVIKKKLSVNQYLSLKHIQVSSRQNGPNKEDFELSRIGLKRKVGLRCQQYFAACRVVSMTEYIVTMPETYAKLMTQLFDVTIYRIPIAVPPLDVHLYWHRPTENDPSFLWMKQTILNVF